MTSYGNSYICVWKCRLENVAHLVSVPMCCLLLTDVTFADPFRYPTRCLTVISIKSPQITKFMGPTWGPPGSCRSQMGPMLAPWTLLSGSNPLDRVILCTYRFHFKLDRQLGSTVANTPNTFQNDWNTLSANHARPGDYMMSCNNMSYDTIMELPARWIWQNYAHAIFQMIWKHLKFDTNAKHLTKLVIDEETKLVDVILILGCQLIVCNAYIMPSWLNKGVRNNIIEKMAL